MLADPPELTLRHEAWLAQRSIVAGQRPHYHKWLRYFLDFCHKYSLDLMARSSLPAFQEKLRTKHQPEALRQQAEQAVALYWEMVSSTTESGLAANANTRQGAEIRNAAHEVRKRTFRQPSVDKCPTNLPVSPSSPTKTTLSLEKKRVSLLRPFALSQPSLRPESVVTDSAPRYR